MQLGPGRTLQSLNSSDRLRVGGEGLPVLTCVTVGINPSYYSLADNDAAAPISGSQADNQWFKDGVKLIQDNLKLKPNTKTAKNVIFFLGDGMSVATVTAARILEGQLRNETGEENFLSFDKFPWTALAKTYNTDLQVADSAGTATAFLCGVKTNGGGSSEGCGDGRSVDQAVRQAVSEDVQQTCRWSCRMW